MWVGWLKVLPPSIHRINIVVELDLIDDEEEGSTQPHGFRTVTALQHRLAFFFVWVHKVQACFAEVGMRMMTGHPAFADTLCSAVALYCGPNIHTPIRKDREDDFADCRTRALYAKELSHPPVDVRKLLRKSDKFSGAADAAAEAAPMPVPDDGVME